MIIKDTKTQLPAFALSGHGPQTPPLHVCVEQSLKAYLAQLEGQQATDLYSIVLAEVEVPLLKVILEYTQHNQSQAAQLLGLSRNTLHKKLKQYHLL